MTTKKQRDWSLVSSHGSVLFFVACNPDCTVDGIADGLEVTSRTAWSLVGDLRRAGMLQVRKSGRRNCYSVNPDAPFRHPTIGGVPLRLVLSRLMTDENGAHAAPAAREVTHAV